MMTTQDDSIPLWAIALIVLIVVAIVVLIVILIVVLVRYFCWTSCRRRSASVFPVNDEEDYANAVRNSKRKLKRRTSEAQTQTYDEERTSAVEQQVQTETSNIGPVTAAFPAANELSVVTTPEMVPVPLNKRDDSTWRKSSDADGQSASRHRSPPAASDVVDAEVGQRRPSETTPMRRKDAEAVELTHFPAAAAVQVVSETRERSRSRFQTSTRPRQASTLSAQSTASKTMPQPLRRRSNLTSGNSRQESTQSSLSELLPDVDQSTKNSAPGKKFKRRMIVVAERTMIE